jgi:hypothetical protein
VPKKQLVRVFKWPNRDYEVVEIYKLIISNLFNIKDDYYKQTLINRSMTIYKKQGEKKNYILLLISPLSFYNIPLLSSLPAAISSFIISNNPFIKGLLDLKKSMPRTGCLAWPYISTSSILITL